MAHGQDMEQLPNLTADLILLHAPAVFDFRHRRDIYFPFLGTSGDVPITPLYEYFPVGFKALQSHLGEEGFVVKIVNLSSLFIRYPNLEITQVLRALDAPLVGLDLHWMVHVQGSLAVAEQLHLHRPEIKVIFGGISSTYYAEQLIAYPFIDMVMRGYDTLAPMVELPRRRRRGENLAGVPNLTWKDELADTHANPMSYLPNSYGCGVDWSSMPQPPPGRKGLPITEVLSTQNAGCAYNCGWCGGSREAFRRIYGRHRAMARKPRATISREFSTLKELSSSGRHHFYSVGSYNESPRNLEFFIEQIASLKLKSVSYEQFHLTPEPMLRRMVGANKRTSITLSPESHDPHIAKLAGRGVYSNNEMEDWLARSLDIGIDQIDIWYFCGMPGQTRESVFETVEYCRHLLQKFRGTKVNPMICPMIPFLDPASTFFEYPDQHGYRVFHRTVEEHRVAMGRASIINRMNYETEYLSREEIVNVGFAATKQLMQAKGEFGFLPNGVIRPYVRRIDDAIEFLAEVHAADCIPEAGARARAIEALGDEILRRNDEIIFGGVANQAFPMNREIGGRWFDEFGWSFDTLDAVAVAQRSPPLS